MNEKFEDTIRVT